MSPFYLLLTDVLKTCSFSSHSFQINQDNLAPNSDSLPRNCSLLMCLLDYTLQWYSNSLKWLFRAQWPYIVSEAQVLLNPESQSPSWLLIQSFSFIWNHVDFILRSVMDISLPTGGDKWKVKTEMKTAENLHTHSSLMQQIHDSDVHFDKNLAWCFFNQLWRNKRCAHF